MARRVLACVDDMFFAAKIRTAAEHLGVDLAIVKSVEDAIDAARHDLPALIIADLHSDRFDPFELAERLNTENDLKGIPLVGFFSHVQTEVQRKAELAGFTKVIPRSVFNTRLRQILEGEF